MISISLSIIIQTIATVFLLQKLFSHLQLYFILQLFDFDNPINTDSSRYIFSTEGHIFSVDKRYRSKLWEDYHKNDDKKVGKKSIESVVVALKALNSSQSHCSRINEERHYLLPLKNEYFVQVSDALGLEDSQTQHLSIYCLIKSFEIQFDN